VARSLDVNLLAEASELLNACGGAGVRQREVDPPSLALLHGVGHHGLTVRGAPEVSERLEHGGTSWLLLLRAASGFTSESPVPGRLSVRLILPSAPTDRRAPGTPADTPMPHFEMLRPTKRQPRDLVAASRREAVGPARGTRSLDRNLRRSLRRLVEAAQEEALHATVLIRGRASPSIRRIWTARRSARRISRSSAAIGTGFDGDNDGVGCKPEQMLHAGLPNAISSLGA